jgi:hypothetical protein
MAPAAQQSIAAAAAYDKGVKDVNVAQESVFMQKITAGNATEILEHQQLAPTPQHACKSE